MIESLFPVDVVTREILQGNISEEIYPEEEIFIRSAVQKRRQEFIAGRICAKRALKEFGIENFPLLMAKDKTPAWPSNIVGSISHTKGYCGVAICRKRNHESLGFDAECINDVKEDILEIICTKDELHLIKSLQAEDQQKMAALIFSAKECFYKYQYPLTRQWIGFHDVEVRTIPGNDVFEISLRINIRNFIPGRKPVSGKYLFRQNYVLTGII